MKMQDLYVGSHYKVKSGPKGSEKYACGKVLRLGFKRNIPRENLYGAIANWDGIELELTHIDPGFVYKSDSGTKSTKPFSKSKLPKTIVTGRDIVSPWGGSAPRDATNELKSAREQLEHAFMSLGYRIKPKVRKSKEDINLGMMSLEEAEQLAAFLGDVAILAELIEDKKLDLIDKNTS